MFDVVDDAVNVARVFLSQLATHPLTNSYPAESKRIATIDMMKPEKDLICHHLNTIQELFQSQVNNIYLVSKGFMRLNILYTYIH